VQEGVNARRLVRPATLDQRASHRGRFPEFITQHLDPFSGDDDTADSDAGTGAVLSNIPLLNIPQQPLPQGEGGVVEAPISRNAPCPCGSGKKYKHCHGQLA
jgi:preprotein translocase subunit SecA